MTFPLTSAFSKHPNFSSNAYCCVRSSVPHNTITYIRKERKRIPLAVCFHCSRFPANNIECLGSTYEEWEAYWTIDSVLRQ